MIERAIFWSVVALYVIAVMMFSAFLVVKFMAWWLASFRMFSS